MPKKKLKMKFVPPQNERDAIEVVVATAMYIDMWMGRTGEWTLIQAFTRMLDESLWNVVKKCVATESGVTLESTKFEQIGVVGMIEAIGIFCEGLMALDIEPVAEKFCAGFSTQGLISLMKDMEDLKSRADSLQSPMDTLSTLFSQAIVRSL